ncbi:Hypothetical predicted protein [Octopus vulgaris]|uniref:Uncharacterized protein n=1 Tax=Octopus vulgaris TaxID=6645 RepID=A0AA36BSS4_OCTVU|nr:Hypothetical predicted protein [Octopus vulgaris]
MEYVWGGDSGGEVGRYGGGSGGSDVDVSGWRGGDVAVGGGGGGVGDARYCVRTISSVRYAEEKCIKSLKLFRFIRRNNIRFSITVVHVEVVTDLVVVHAVVVVVVSFSTPRVSFDSQDSDA